MCTRLRSQALAAGGEAAALLAVLGVGERAGADAELLGARVDQSAAARGAVGVAGALARDELLAGAVADVVDARRVRDKGAGLDGTAGCGVVAGVVPGVVVLVAAVAALAVVVAALVVVVAGVVTSIVTGVVVAAVVVLLAAALAGLKAAALLTGLGLSTHTGADADGLAALRKGCAAARGAVGNAKALAADELDAAAVADVLLTRRVGEVLAARDIRGSLDGREGN